MSAPVSHGDNRFNLIRLAAAVAVLLSHGEFLYRLTLPVPFPGHTLGSLAVYCFFFVSGYLVFQSWEREPALGVFWVKRVARIFPGLVVASAFSVFVVGWAMTRLPTTEYWTHPGTWLNFFNNAAGIATVQVLPGVFESNPFARAVNGSLWSIRYELLMYLVLSVAGVAAGLRRRWVFPVGALSMAAWWFLARCMGAGVAAPAWLSELFGASEVSALGVLFLLGCSCAAYRVRTHAWMLIAAACGAWIASVATSAGKVQLGVWAMVAAGTFWLARAGVHRWRWNGFPREDFSYGVYIYAFPIQQAITEICLRRGWSLPVCLVLSLGLTFAMAAFSWHCVEKPCIWQGRRLANWLRSARRPDIHRPAQ
ncbi:Peptidoglycan/LPS O-acetylase OafA/YrhL, contains acyltransferase and SGNH-hydrolase domains [Paracidovorax cattleyae]|uniref:Peptidoglycan/LPS O-acetylase OafA/YrhL, contains acyltransferase and SGNH-hydrolase domains n=1 Tax=Paracidovorax cattleyae TaxID=80868 RepID=A0A1H0VP62_9BURK|nr:acyltransferase [Paracidovorax cattleyae]SDP80051.1 Peptidoglycan/LPS O-acetylase OafA/YrhL, contains acyltransferase and SGNH-hydrolase domains [Paracidovorax cattleyae]